VESVIRLADATLALSKLVDLPEIAHTVVEELPRLLDCEQVRLFQYDRKRDEFHTQLRMPESQVSEYRCPAGEGIRGEVASRRALQRVENPPSHELWCQRLDQLTGCVTRNLLAAPLVYATDDSLFGVLELINKLNGEFDSHDEILLSAFLKHAEAAIERARYVQEIRAQHELDASLQAAREIQRRFMPERMPALPGYEVATWWLPNETVGGDYCDVLPLTANKLGLCVADVSGHGLGPSLLMASVRAALHALILEHKSPQVLMEMLSDTLRKDLHFAGFVTMVLASLDYENHRLEYSNAGHAPALHYSARTKAFRPLEATGPPVGVLEDAEFPLGPTLAMEPGDWMLLCTDGIVEAIDTNEVQFGYERLHGIVLEHVDVSAADLVRIIGSRVEQHYLEEHPQDDLTILALRRLPH
jgi:serine phosphatase RsbU (regulator of sigma subunit)